jgi:hypothetical protein
MVAEFKGATSGNEIDATKARAHLPGLDIEIVHRRSPQGDAEFPWLAAAHAVMLPPIPAPPSPGR